MEEEYLKDFIRKKIILFNLLFFINILTPYTTWSYYIQIISFFIVIIFLKNSFSILDTKTIFIICAIFISFMLALFWSNTTGQNYLRFANILLLFLFFPLTQYFSIKPTVLFLILTIIFISQLVYFLNIPQVIKLINNIYPQDIYQNAIGNGSFNLLITKYTFRTGGIYHNPNNCGQVLNLLLVIYIIESKNRKLQSNLFFYLILFLAIILTGSRTTALITILIILYYLFRIKNYNNRVPLFAVFILFIIIISVSELRIFNFIQNVQSHYHSSLTSKFGVLNYYVGKIDFAHLLWGNFNLSILQNMNLIREFGMNIFDNEIGYLIYSLGFFGLLAFIIFYYRIYREGNSYAKLIIILALWSITSSVFFQFKFSFIFMLILSNYYQYSYTKAEYLKILYPNEIQL